MKLEAAAPDSVVAAVRAPLLAADCQMLEAPVAQPLGLYLDIAGEGLRERLFVIEGPPGAEACLRPDFTVAAVMAHIASGAERGRYSYQGHAFRVAPPQSGRAEEFLQIGLESFGEEPGGTFEAAIADAAMAAMAWRSSVAGGRKDLALILGDVGLFGAFLGAAGVEEQLGKRLAKALSDPRRLRLEIAAGANAAHDGVRAGESLAQVLAPLSEADASAVLQDIWALAGIEPVGGRSAAEIAGRLAERSGVRRLTPDQAALIERLLAISGPPRGALAEVAALGAHSDHMRRHLEAWEHRLTELARRDVPEDRMAFDAGFGRAFGYYDGALFEVRSAALGPDQPVAAGGRYDSLPAKLGGAAGRGALGCMVRPVRAWRDAPS